MIKIAIVGTGIIGLDHIKAISQIEECSLCALCDVNEEVVKKFGDVEIHDLTIHLTGHYKDKNKTFIPRFEVVL